jgi:hypothetical protein
MRWCALGLLLLLFANACTSDQPPPIQDSDASFHNYVDVYVPFQPVDAGDASAPTYQLDFQGVCMAGFAPVWHFFDFETHTPGMSALEFSAATADTEALLGGAQVVPLATVTGPDITVYQGVDVASALANHGLMSKVFLRVSTVELADPDAGAPVLEHYRQSFDCVASQ